MAIYRHNGKRNTASYLKVTLKEARELLLVGRDVLVSGRDPNQEKQLRIIKNQQSAGITFQFVAGEWLEVKKHEWL